MTLIPEDTHRAACGLLYYTKDGSGEEDVRGGSTYISGRAEFAQRSRCLGGDGLAWSCYVTGRDCERVMKIGRYNYSFLP